MKNILILDNNKDILNALHAGLCACLKECGVLTASNAEKGNAILKTQAIDLVLTDLDMPIMNGYQFIEQTRRDHPSIPVCVMTGACPTQVKDRLSAMGVKQVLTKPFPMESLARMVSEELGVAYSS